MKAALVLAILTLALLAPAAVAQDPPGPACARTDAQRSQGTNATLVMSVRAEASSQEIVVSWAVKQNVLGYRVWLFDGGEATVFETSAAECVLAVTNGRTYAIQVAAIASDGTLGPRSDPVAAAPAFEHDFLFLALGLLAVWAGVWFYVVLLVRQQRRLVERYEALFKSTGSGGQP